MNKLKGLFEKISSSIKEVYRKYPITIIFSYLTTIFLVFVLEHISGNFGEYTTLFLGLETLGAFFIETFLISTFKNIDKNKILVIGLLTSTIISIFFSYINGYYLDMNEYICRICTTYMIVLLTLIVYNFINNENEEEFTEYISKVFYNFLKTSIIFSVAISGIFIVIAIFGELILDNDYSIEIYTKTIGLLTGLYYIPSLIYCFIEKKDEVGKFLRVIYTYVFLPLISIGILIVYIYVVKLILKGNLLKDSIFTILAVIYAFLYPILLLINGLKENKREKTCKIVAIAYCPLILLEIAALYIRISTYGLTATRFMGCVFILVQIISFILYFVKNKMYLKYIIMTLAFIASILLITPLYPEEVAIRSQKNTLEKLYSSESEYFELSNEDKMRVKGAYNYLYYKIDDKDYLDSKVTTAIKDDFNEIEGSSDDSEEYVYASVEIDGFDITKYKKIYETSSYQYSNVNVKKVKFEFANNMKVETDLTDLFETLVNASDESNTNNNLDNILEENRVITIDDKYDLVLTHVNFDYKNIDTITYMSVSGYILEK